MQRYKFGFDGCYVSIDQFIKQNGLIRAQLFAALGKLEALELRDLVGQLFRWPFCDGGFAYPSSRFSDRDSSHAASTARQSAQLFSV